MRTAEALTGGRWVTVKGIRRWVGDRPADEPLRAPSRVVPAQRIIELHAAGLPDKKIGELTGVSASAIAKRRQKLGLTVTRNVAECGTDSGYKRHLREGDDACEPCLAAHREASAKTNARRPRKKAA